MPKKIKKTKSSEKKIQADANASNLLHFPRREAMEGMMSGMLGGGNRLIEISADYNA